MPVKMLEIDTIGLVHEEIKCLETWNWETQQNKRKIVHTLITGEDSDAKEMKMKDKAITKRTRIDDSDDSEDSSGKS
jgi:hypothetical protein